MTSLEDRLEQLFGMRPLRVSSLHGGCIAEVRRADMPDGTRLVVKIAKDGGTDGVLPIEARMLETLQATGLVPVPHVLHVVEDLLVMEYIEAGDSLSGAAEEDLARIVAALHSVTDKTFGLDFDTVIAALPQSNRRSESWVEFYRDERLKAMNQTCLEAGRYGNEMSLRLSAFCNQLDQYIEEDTPALLHGDLWQGNILTRGNKVVALIDPAIYFGIDEVDLAFMTMFSSVSRRFFDVYGEIRPIKDDFFEKRRDIYNLWPILVHICLFGGHYVASLDRVLRQNGC